MSQENKPKAEMQLGNYTLSAKLSEGILSEVWLAEHMYLESKENCLKIFTNEKFIRILENQKFLRLVKDPLHLPMIEDYDPSPPFPYLAQEVLAGRSIRQLLQGKKADLTYALDLFSKTVQALQSLHAQNVFHLDLRPEHILFDNNGNVKFLDYILGQVTTLTIAEYYREFTSKGTPIPKPIMRSLLYKSKQHRMGLDLTAQADIYSLGIILFEMVTGTYPTKKAEFPSNLVENLPPKIDAIYSGCCSKGEDFFSSCEEILQAIAHKDLQQNFGPGVVLFRENAAVISVTTLAGEKNYVDGKNINLLSKNLEALMGTQLKFFAFDLQNIDYLNSSALGYMVNFYDRVQAMKGAVVMFHVDKKVMTIMGALGLEKVMHIVQQEQNAKEYIINKIHEGSKTG